MIEAADAVVTFDPDQGPPSDPLLAQYGAMKVGDLDVIGHYGSVLAERAAAWFAEQRHDVNGVVVTAPPMFALPAAANLLADAMARDPVLSDGVQRATTVKLRRAPFGTLLLEPHYGSRSETSRRAYLERSASEWHSDDGLRGAVVVFVNDVRVTGAQERRTAQHLRAQGVRMVRWQYLCAMDPAPIGERSMVETHLNRKGMEDDDLVRRLGRPAMATTTSLVWRLLALDNPTLVAATGEMTVEHCAALTRILLAEKAPRSGALLTLFELLAQRRPGQEVS